MAFSVTLSNTAFPSLPRFPQTLRTTSVRFPLIRAVQSGEANSPESKSEGSSNAQSSSAAPRIPKKPVYSMKKGQIVRVDKEKYLNSVNYLSVGHPPYYKGLDYIYEDRGEVLDMRIFETGEHALVSNLHLSHRAFIEYRIFRKITSLSNVLIMRETTARIKTTSLFTMPMMFCSLSKAKPISIDGMTYVLHSNYEKIV
ncbi:NAD(P)H-quinone oxidoreductase subunit O [Spatholobus suberectus]|nr:NAD(P)H-quinone oxidoreductase subunit O [Spatholobus suberectus]